MYICQLMVHVLHIHVVMYQFFFTFTSNHFGVDSGYWSALSGRTIWSVGYSIKSFPWRFSHNDLFWSSWWYLEWIKTQHWNWCRNLWSVQIELENKKTRDDILFSECQFKIQDLLWCDLSSLTSIHLSWYLFKLCALYIYSWFLRDSMGQDNDNLSKSVCL